MNNKIFEWAGVITAILYSLFVALNIGIEFFGFCLLLLSAILIGIWGLQGRPQRNSFTSILLCDCWNYRV